MILHTDPLLYIYFGDARSALAREFLMGSYAQEELWKNERLNRVKKIMHLDSLVLLKQIHSIKGVAIPDTPQYYPFSDNEGDFLVTQREHTGLGVYTADCLPIIFYDTCNRAVGICHAGWRGSVEGIAIKTISAMQEQYGTDLDHLRIFFGPSAKVCCYEVTEEFTQHLEQFEFAQDVVFDHNGTLFFDLQLFNKLLIESFGVKRNAFHCNYNMCTICDESFCSSRRDGASERQLTIVALK
jgi:polyphenol oxidase